MMEDTVEADDSEDPDCQNIQVGIFTISNHLALRIKRHNSKSYKVEESAEEEEEEERVRVEYYIHEKTVKERLKSIFITGQKSSVRWQGLRFFIKLFSCVIYVVRACLDGDPTEAGCAGCPKDRANSTRWCCPDVRINGKGQTQTLFSLLWVNRPVTIWGIQVAIGCFAIFDVFLSSYLNYKGHFFAIINRYMILDIITALPFIVSIFMPDIRNLYGITFLHCWIAKNSLETLLNDLHRLRVQQQSGLSQKVTIVVASVVNLVFTSVCGIQHLERASSNWTMFDGLWFVVVTFSTVGYGDTVPKDWLARSWVIIMIILALLILPQELEEMAFLIISRQKEGGVYNSVLGTSRHVVVCATRIRASTMIDFLNEFYADPKMQDMHVVLLSPSEIDSNLRILLQVPLWAQRVTYLKGSALNDTDLIRAKVIDASGVFILGDRGNPDIEAADYQTIMRTWAIQDFAPATHLYVQIQKPENKFHVSFAENIVCEDEIKHALLASNCICPGISTLMTLLLHTLREQKVLSHDKCEKVYGRSAGNEIYDIRLGDSQLFRRFAYKTFTHAAYHAFKRFGVTLIGIRHAAAESPIVLNPGPSFKLSYDDTLFYIAVTSEADMDVEEITKTKGANKLKFARDEWRSFISVIDHNDDDKNTDMELKPVDVFNTNGSLAQGIESLCTPPPHRMKSPCDINITIASGSDFSELPTSPFASDTESEAEPGGLSIPFQQSIPRYQIGVPPVTPYIGRTPLKCHLHEKPKLFCCMELNKSCTHLDRLGKVDQTKKITGGVIIASPRAGAGLYNFILPLRAFYRPKCTLKPIVLLLNERPSTAFLEAVCAFPLLYFIVGSFRNVDDLLQAGILEAENFVVTDHRQVPEGVWSDEEYMADAYTIIGVQTIYRLFPHTGLIVELAHPSNMRFMKFDVSVVDDFVRKKKILKKTVQNRKKQIQAKKDHLGYLFREPFAAGNVFSASMIDTLLYQTFLKGYMIKLITLLLGCEQCAGSGYLTSMAITADRMWIGTYGRLFQRLCTTTYEIPIGLYRIIKEKSNGQTLVLEHRDIFGIIKDKLKRLGIKAHHDMSTRPDRCYTFINPPPDFELEEGDLIYLIRTSPTMQPEALDPATAHRRSTAI